MSHRVPGVLIDADDGTLLFLPGEEQPVTLGRAPACDLRIRGRGVSRRHCRVDPADDGYRIVDLDSLNGVAVNGRRVGARRLRRGDLVRIGERLFVFVGGHGERELPPQDEDARRPSDRAAGGRAMAQPARNRFFWGAAAGLVAAAALGAFVARGRPAGVAEAEVDRGRKPPPTLVPAPAPVAAVPARPGRDPRVRPLPVFPSPPPLTPVRDIFAAPRPPAASAAAGIPPAAAVVVVAVSPPADPVSPALSARELDRRLRAQMEEIAIGPEERDRREAAEESQRRAAEAARREAEAARGAPGAHVVRAAGDSRIDEAVRRGVASLRETAGPNGPKDPRSEELMLYALAHGGLPRGDAVFQDLLKRVVDKAPAATYNAAIGAMCLADLDRAGYQWKLVQFAQFLADNQCRNGQWSYGAPGGVVPTPAGGRPGDPELYGTRYPAGWTGGGSGTRPLPQVLVRPQRQGPASGDNSNSQYAALGLRACAEAGVRVEGRVLERAARAWADGQAPDGGWGYTVVVRGTEALAPGVRRPRGEEAYASMTAGGVSSLVIYDWLQGGPWKDDARVRRGLDWLAKEWDSDDDRRYRGWSPYYFLYGLERAGVLYGTDTIGTHAWYKEGAEWLLAAQQRNGAWGGPADTCFAILFLKRATRAIVYTEK